MGQHDRMPLTTRLALLAACVPLVLSGCSDSGAATPSPTPAAPTSTATLPVALAYVVTAREGVSDQDLKDALGRLAAMEGVVGASLTGPRKLRVDLTTAMLPDSGAAIVAELRKLGTVTVP
ncbi:MAG: hypothetical protein JWN87_2344 [Frankiales bacterium]|nr:hypothetical protein [Frankiales bacterium]